MSNWAKECKELKTGLIGLAVTKSIPRKTRQRITKCGDAAVKFIVDPLGEISAAIQEADANDRDAEV